MKKNILILATISLGFAVQAPAEDTSQKLLLGTSDDLVRSAERVLIYECSRDDLDGFLREKGNAAVADLQDKLIIRSILTKAREASEQSSGKKAGGKYLGVVVMYAVGPSAKFVIMDSDAVILVKDNGEMGSSYPSPGIYDETLKDVRKLSGK